MSIVNHIGLIGLWMVAGMLLACLGTSTKNNTTTIHTMYSLWIVFALIHLFGWMFSL